MSPSGSSRWVRQGLGRLGLGPSWLVPSWRRLMWRTTAVALNACCREKAARTIVHQWQQTVTVHLTGLRFKTHLPLAFGKVLLDLSTDRLMDVLIQSCVSSDPDKDEKKTKKVLSFNTGKYKQSGKSKKKNRFQNITRDAAVPGHRCNVHWGLSPLGGQWSL